MTLFADIASIFQEPCTFWFNQLFGRKWSHCCKEHDKGYDQFELSYDRYAYRLMCDEELMSCVNKELQGMGNIMFLGVRVFGRIALYFNREDKP